MQWNAHFGINLLFESSSIIVVQANQKVRFYCFGEGRWPYFCVTRELDMMSVWRGPYVIVNADTATKCTDTAAQPGGQQQSLIEAQIYPNIAHQLPMLNIHFPGSQQRNRISTTHTDRWLSREAIWPEPGFYIRLSKAWSRKKDVTCVHLSLAHTLLSHW